jgi:IS30 family transposase
MPRSFRHLDLSERVFIETQLRLGMRPAGIAARLRRARSTISREIGRNGWRAKLRKGAIAGGYRCVAADRRARVLAGKARRRRKLEPGNQLWMTMLAQSVHSRHDLDRPKTCRSGHATGSRALGRRPHHWQGKPFSRSALWSSAQPSLSPW